MIHMSIIKKDKRKRKHHWPASLVSSFPLVTTNMILTEELWTVQSYIELFSNGCPTNLRPTICPHCQEAVMLHKHGSFKRTVYTLLEAFIISVYRFKCIECGRATSLLPNFVMEHHQVAWDVKEEVIRQHLSGVALVKIAEDLETSAGKLSVGVKKQKENGRNPDKNRKEKREYVHNTIAHVEKGNNRYILNGSSSEQVLKLLLAFLLHNGLLNGHNLLFFVDGARSLQAAILTMFQWLPHVRIILDLSLIHISEPTRLGMISYAVFCLKKKKKKNQNIRSLHLQ